MMSPSSTPAPTSLAVIGGGIMGRGIATVAAQRGYHVTLIDRDPAALQTAIDAARSDCAHPRSPYRDRIDEVLARLTTSTETSAVREADAVIEAVPENLDLKRAIFAEVEQLVRPDALLATNTSALSVSAIAAGMADPSRLIGMHFFNPVPRMSLIEIVIGLATSEQALRGAEELATGLGKTSVRIKNRPGFVTSRMNVLIGNEAFRMLTEGVASAEDIDTALKLGLNHPMGPFELVDLVGLDTRIAVLRSLEEAYGERFRPDPSLVALVDAGRLGRKTGRGVFAYDAQGHRIPDEESNA